MCLSPQCTCSQTTEQTASTLIVFVLAMMHYPEVQERAQRDIDAVIGTNKLPDFGDRPFLPYTDAILRETLRWHPVFPLGKWACEECIDHH